MCQLYSVCTSKLQSKKAFVNHWQRFLFAEDFSIVSATVSLRCDLTSIARSPTETIKTTRATCKWQLWRWWESKDMVGQDSFGWSHDDKQWTLPSTAATRSLIYPTTDYLSPKYGTFPCLTFLDALALWVLLSPFQLVNLSICRLVNLSTCQF